MGWRKKDKDRSKKETRVTGGKKPEKKAEAPKPKPKPEPKPEPKAEVKPAEGIVHTDFGGVEPEPKPVVKPAPAPVPEGDQAVVSGHFDGSPARCVLSKTPAGYSAQLIRKTSAGPRTSVAAPYKDLEAALTWARAIMPGASVRMQAQVPVAEIAKELA